MQKVPSERNRNTVGYHGKCHHTSEPAVNIIHTARLLPSPSNPSNENQNAAKEFRASDENTLVIDENRCNEDNTREIADVSSETMVDEEKVQVTQQQVVEEEGHYIII